MIIEYHLFSKLECKTATIFSKIQTTVTKGLSHIDILEKNIYILFKFMILSLRRSEQYREEVKSPYRQSDFMFHGLFEAAKRRGRTGEPGQWWLDELL